MKQKTLFFIIILLVSCSEHISETNLPSYTVSKISINHSNEKHLELSFTFPHPKDFDFCPILFTYDDGEKTIEEKVKNLDIHDNVFVKFELPKNSKISDKICIEWDISDPFLVLVGGICISRKDGSEIRLERLDSQIIALSGHGVIDNFILNGSLLKRS